MRWRKGRPGSSRVLYPNAERGMMNDGRLSPHRFLWTIMCPMLKKAAFVLLIATSAFGERDPKFFAEMRWRMIGPFRGGRTVAGVGVRGQPSVFYIGVNN